MPFILGLAIAIPFGLLFGWMFANVDEARGDSKAGCAFLLVLVGGGILVILALGGVK